jgi:hypothetical protein
MGGKDAEVELMLDVLVLRRRYAGPHQQRYVQVPAQGALSRTLKRASPTCSDLPAH